jgi:leucyl aminopeptidase
MGLFLGVAEASMQPPAFIHLTYKPQGEAKKKVWCVFGAGVCAAACHNAQASSATAPVSAD